ncbi:HicB family protein [Micrococcales bacterium KH10]|nr:HicB family protein [Micrococcales bacterium KH10]
MGMLQVKNVPPELHSALAARAKTQGLSMSDYVIRLLSQDLSRPTVEEWVAARQESAPVKGIDAVRLIDEVRVEFDIPSGSESVVTAVSDVAVDRSRRR